VIVESNSIYAKNLKGIGIGNGWVDPYLQYAAYAQYMLMEGYIGQETADIAAELYKACKILIDLKLYLPAFPVCQIIEASVLEAAEIKEGRSINVYDVKQKCEQPPLCYNLDNITKFMNTPEVMEDLGVNRTWEACRHFEEVLLIGDWVHSFQGAVAIVLAHGRRVVVYSGKDDYICNYLGGKAWVESTKWSGQADFDKAAFKNWMLDGRLAGSVKSGAGLTFIEVENAGHMVPMNQPQVALAILNNTIHDIPFTN
jgi:carboxypeptidase C (cathepsin A)